MKIALISHYLPPSESGQAIFLYRLLKPPSAFDYCLMSNLPCDRDSIEAGYTERLPCHYYHLPSGHQITRGYRLRLRTFINNTNFVLAILQRARRVAQLVRQEKCDAIVACTGDATLLPAGYLASRLAGVPFYAFIIDHYSHREAFDPLLRAWAKRLEPILIKGADGVITMNDFLRDDLRARFGVEAGIVYNSCDLDAYSAEMADVPEKQSDDETRIVYTGAIYDAHFDAFHNLLKALSLLGRQEIVLHVYTAQPLKYLASNGICGPVEYHPHEALSEMPQVQRSADVLFLPLAFNSPYPGVIKTSATTKLGEYLAARRPILVHAPADSFVSWYFRRHECGLVVDEADAEKLSEALTRLLGDKELQRRLVARAWERAQIDFSMEKARKTFATLLGAELEA